ncbi:MAG: hypothetical protein D6683_13670 [Actinomyces sp.]|nr:MAG: hypothetical protein D6683_13670 [Actinomyces sp.]
MTTERSGEAPARRPGVGAVVAAIYLVTAALVAAWALAGVGADAAETAGSPAPLQYPATGPTGPTGSTTTTTTTVAVSPTYPTTSPTTAPTSTTTTLAPSRDPGPTTTTTLVPRSEPAPLPRRAPRTTTTTTTTTTSTTTTTTLAPDDTDETGDSGGSPAAGVVPLGGDDTGGPDAGDEPDPRTDGGATDPALVVDPDGAAPPVVVDLDDPGELLAAVSAATPPARLPRSTGEGATGTTTGRFRADDGAGGRAPGTPPPRPQRAPAVLPVITDAYGALLELEVPALAVVSGLAWQLALVAAPGLLSRRRRLVDIVGVPPDAVVGDDTFAFRGDATALPAGRRRRRRGRWERAVESPRGTVWLPTSILRETVL